MSDLVSLVQKRHAAPVQVDLENEEEGSARCLVLQNVQVELVPLPLRMQGPAAVAWHLCQLANLNEEQVDAVALVARQLQNMWPHRTEQGFLPASWAHENLAVMFLGGGGCGKTHTILNVIKPLVECYFGRDGFEGQCPSNAGARLFGGRTVHSSIGLSATSSLKVERLSLKGKARTKVEQIGGPAGALVIDEVSQLSAPLLHANALRHTYGRARRHGLEVNRYLTSNELFGRMPVVILSGDYLQLPPVPESSSVLWAQTNASYEHRQGRSIIDRVPCVFEFCKANRFKDERLARILLAMREPGGKKVLDADWQALEARLLELATSKQGVAQAPDNRLLEAADWLESSYDWLTVSLAIQLRIRMAAHAAQKVLFYIVAVDLPPFDLPVSIYRAMTAVPNVTTTKKLPGILPVYVGARVRLTKTLLAPKLVPEMEGEVLGIELSDQDLGALQTGGFGNLADDGSILLQCLPKCIYVRFDGLNLETMDPRPCEKHAVLGAERSCSDCTFYTGIVAILPELSEWTFKQTGAQRSKHLLKPAPPMQIEVRRRQFPLLPALPKTLHSLQGMTAEPGLVAHCRLPPNLSQETKWLAYYVMLSRVRSLSTLLLHGMPERAILEGGPPASLQSAMDTLFSPKVAKTKAACAAARRELGWPQGAAVEIGKGPKSTRTHYGMKAWKAEAEVPGVSKAKPYV